MRRATGRAETMWQGAKTKSINLQVDNANSQSVKLTWERVGWAKKYEIWRWSPKAQQWQKWRQVKDKERTQFRRLLR